MCSAFGPRILCSDNRKMFLFSFYGSFLFVLSIWLLIFDTPLVINTEGKKEKKTLPTEGLYMHNWSDPVKIF